MSDVTEKGCETCGLRKKYDANPKSLSGRFWRWHIKWCPGWKEYMMSLSKDERLSLARHYNLKKYQNV